MMRITFFFFNDTATTEIYTLSLHDALPISQPSGSPFRNPSFGGSIILGRGAGIDYAYLDRRDRRPLHLVGLRFTL